MIAMNKEPKGNPDYSEKPSNRDFFHVLFSAVTGDSGLVAAGYGRGRNDGTSD
jgi:hypothetical protein